MAYKKRCVRIKGKQLIRDVVLHTPVIKMTFLLVVLWVLFSAGIYLGKRGIEGTTITSYGKSLY